MDRIVMLFVLVMVTFTAGCGKQANDGHPKSPPDNCVGDDCFCGTSGWWWSKESGRLRDGSGQPIKCKEGANEPQHFPGAQIHIWGASYCHNCGPTKEWFAKRGVSTRYYITDKEASPTAPPGHDRLPICAIEQGGQFVADADGFLGCIELYEQMR